MTATLAALRRQRRRSREPLTDLSAATQAAWEDCRRRGGSEIDPNRLTAPRELPDGSARWRQGAIPVDARLPICRRCNVPSAEHAVPAVALTADPFGADSMPYRSAGAVLLPVAS